MSHHDHIIELLEKHGIKATWKGPSHRGRAFQRTREVHLPPVRSATTYALALHEIGHIVAKTSGRRLDQEAQAWQWAEQNSIEWTEPMIKKAARCMKSYLRWCERRKGAWIPPQDHPARRIAEWE
jgi:hypothetical protein